MDRSGLHELCGDRWGGITVSNVSQSGRIALAVPLQQLLYVRIWTGESCCSDRSWARQDRGESCGPVQLHPTPSKYVQAHPITPKLILINFPHFRDYGYP
jgi:hypothetical protein